MCWSVSQSFLISPACLWHSAPSPLVSTEDENIEIHKYTISFLKKVESFLRLGTAVFIKWYSKRSKHIWCSNESLQQQCTFD